MTSITTTRMALIRAFDEWEARYDADPDSFNNESEDTTYGEDCADFLVRLLLEDAKS